MSYRRLSVCASIGLLVLSAGTPASGEIQDCSKLKVYYYGWDVMTRSRLSIDQVRNGAQTTIEINHREEIRGFLNWSGINALQRSSEPVTNHDPRLVIDCYSPRGLRQTYFASRFRMFSLDGERSAELEDGFRRWFVLHDR